jgi:hypothetical protein
MTDEHKEVHRTERIGWLRAAVLGANDGIVSTASLVVIWGRAEYVEGDDALLRQVADPDYDAKLERAIVFHIEAWDSNCPQHISPRYTVDELAGHGFARA